MKGNIFMNGIYKMTERGVYDTKRKKYIVGGELIELLNYLVDCEMILAEYTGMESEYND